MTKAILLCSAAFLLIGCAGSHRERVVYYPVTTPAPAPTSDRPGTRVYAAPEMSPSGHVSGSDVALADSISNVLKSDDRMSNATANVIVTVKNGKVTLRGITPTKHDRDEIVRRVSQLPGVEEVRDELGVDH